MGGPSCISFWARASLPSTRTMPREVDGNSATQATRPSIEPNSSRLTVHGDTRTRMPGRTRLPAAAGTKSTAISSSRDHLQVEDRRARG